MDWIEQLKEIARDPYRAVPQLVKSNLKNADGSRRLPVARPPVSPDDIKEFEGKSGMKLPNDLVRVYLEVGNGSFGPGYGLFQLLCDEKEIELYREKLIQDRDQFSLQNLWTDSLVESAIRRRRATSGMLNWNLLFWSNKTANDYRGRWPNHILQFCGAGCDLVGVIDIRTERVGFVQYEFLEGEPSKKIHGEPLENIIE